MILGIDIGASGAIAVLDGEGNLVTVEDMPCLKDGPAGRRTVNAPLLASIIFKPWGPCLRRIRRCTARRGCCWSFRLWPLSRRGRGRSRGRRRPCNLHCARVMETRCWSIDGQ